tara:strand:+ start:40504 stop:41556 length:1053 start_codon:yes stop_codon:yes gene_type:complete
MKKIIAIFGFLIILSSSASAQYESDTRSIDSIINTMYASISGDAGVERDWDRFRNLFIPEARLIPTGNNNNESRRYVAWDVEKYIERATPMFKKDGFFESEVSREVDEFNGVAQVFTTYESRRTKDGDVFARGINSVQLFNDGTRWWIVSIFWASENEEHPLPLAYQKGTWFSLFNGENFDGWVANETDETFSIEDGAIKVNGVRSHLFYNGPVADHDFDDFEFKAKVMTKNNSNSGIFFHTKYQPEGWPRYGYEAQINNSYDADPRRTASLYSFDDNTEITFPDDEWMDYYIKVEGKHVIIKINGIVVTDYTEPEGLTRTQRLTSGTFALQGHDPGSTVYFKDIYVREL